MRSEQYRTLGVESESERDAADSGEVSMIKIGKTVSGGDSERRTPVKVR